MRFPFIEQPDEKDCGPTCLAILSKYYGNNVSISKLREFAGTDLYGTNILGMIRGGEKIGLSIEGFEIEKKQELENIKTPFIAHIENDSGFDHFIIVKKITKSHFYITDPAKGHLKIKDETFYNLFNNIVLTVEKSKNFFNIKSSISLFAIFFDIFKQNQAFIWLIFFCSIVINIIGIVGSFYFKYLVDDIIPSSFLDNLNNFSLAIFMLYIISFLISLLRYQLTLNMGLKINENLMLSYYKHLLRLPMNFFETRKEGEILSRFRDSDYIREAFSTVTVTLFLDVTMIIIGSFILYLQSSKLFFVVLCIMPLYVLLSYFFTKPFKKYNRKTMESEANVSSAFIEGVKGIDTIKSYNAEKLFFNKLHNYFNKFIENVYKLGSLTNIQFSIKEFFMLVSTLIILWVGATKVINNSLTLGELLTFNALVAFYFTPIERLIESQSVIQSALVATKRVVEILDLSKEENNKNQTKSTLFDSEIKFNNISFGYGARENILTNISFVIPKNKKIAIVGESGSGKSTIAKLLLNYYSPKNGEILDSNVNINDLNLTEWRNKISYVSQESFIFYGTVKENLMLGINKKNISDFEIINACKITEAHDFISKLPQGYNTILESNGENLSGGQKQRISLARAILKKPDILILDEPTSSLDSKTERTIQNKLNNMDLTILTISHRLNIVCDYDNIIVLSNGTIVEQGTHNNLIDRKSYYYNLWKNQMSDYI